jgi:hypothetical protein
MPVGEESFAYSLQQALYFVTYLKEVANSSLANRTLGSMGCKI